MLAATIFRDLDFDVRPVAEPSGRIDEKNMMVGWFSWLMNTWWRWMRQKQSLVTSRECIHEMFSILHDLSKKWIEMIVTYSYCNTQNDHVATGWNLLWTHGLTVTSADRGHPWWTLPAKRTCRRGRCHLSMFFRKYVKLGCCKTGYYSDVDTDLFWFY